jgi:sulfatase maturation enzyme AslB (radical SAM superfamily)
MVESRGVEPLTLRCKRNVFPTILTPLKYLMPYCVQPFINIRIDSDSEYKPCCHYKDSIPAQSVTDYLNSTELFTLQQHLLTDNPLPPGCQLCHKQESKGQLSFRQRYNDFFKSKNQTQITHLEMLVNNTCNLKCFMCDPVYSTALGSERKSLGWIKSYPVINHKQQVASAIDELPDLESVSFIGGEFFFSKDNISLLEQAIERNLKINIATNATTLLSKHIDLLKQATKADIQVSLDGIEESYDFMRYPATWEVVKDNIILLKKTLPNQCVHVSTVAQPLNIQYIAPLMAWCNKNLLEISIVNLQAPSWLEWRILTKEERTLILTVLDQCSSDYQLTSTQKDILSQFKSTFSLIEFDQNFRNEFVKKMQSIMSLRNISDNTVIKHFGVLSNLAQSIIEKT